jgi:hypothetical protein
MTRKLVLTNHKGNVHFLTPPYCNSRWLRFNVGASRILVSDSVDGSLRVCKITQKTGTNGLHQGIEIDIGKLGSAICTANQDIPAIRRVSNYRHCTEVMAGESAQLFARSCIP